MAFQYGCESLRFLIYIKEKKKILNIIHLLNLDLMQKMVGGVRKQEI